jgi:hypothetical protein
VLTLLERALPTRRPDVGSATRHEGGAAVTVELEARLARLEAQINAEAKAEG